MLFVWEVFLILEDLSIKKGFDRKNWKVVVQFYFGFKDRWGSFLGFFLFGLVLFSKIVEELEILIDREYRRIEKCKREV